MYIFSGARGTQSRVVRGPFCKYGFMGPVWNMDPNVSFHFVSVSLDLIEVSFDIRGGARGGVDLSQRKSLFFEHGFMGSL